MYLLVFMVEGFLCLLVAKLNKILIKSKFWRNIFIIGNKNKKFVVS